jgi:signal transduction histidine kinase
LCLYRIAQEALRNVVKHSGAGGASVVLVGQNGALTLEVRDTGQGFDPAEAAGQGGLGLVSMRERLRLLAGELTVESQPGGGTRLLAFVPLAMPASASLQSMPHVTSD